MSKKPHTPASAYTLTLYMLGRKAYAVKELATKLRQKDIALEVVEEVLTRLQKEGFLNDARYAEGKIRYRAETCRWGERRILGELKEKGISQELATKAMEEWKEEQKEKQRWASSNPEGAEDDQDIWLTQATELLRKKYGALPEHLKEEPKNATWEERTDWRKDYEKEKARRLRFLIGKGYSLSQAMAALNAVKE